MKLVIRFVMSLFFDNKETAKVALLCSDSNKALDPNKYKREENPMEMHLQFVIQQKQNLTDLKMEELKHMMNRIKQLAPSEDFIVELHFLEDLQAYSEQIKKAMDCIEAETMFSTIPSP